MESSNEIVIVITAALKKKNSVRSCGINPHMAKVFLTCMEESVARDLRCVLAIEKHRIEQRPPDTRIDDFLDADIVFAGDDARQYVPLLRGVRLKRPALPFVVVTKHPDTSKWLDALEAGASDYCSAPFESRQIHWLMQSVLPSVWGASMNAGHGLRRVRFVSPPVT